MRKQKNKKVVIAMSGGVDSSVAAALLKRAEVDELRSSSRTSSLERVRKNFNSFGFANSRVFDVIGVFMKFWKAPNDNGLIGGWNRCCSPEAETRARKVAKILKIPFYVFNFEKEFKKRIVDYFLEEYRRGVPPNPCVVCNKEIKFGLLLEKALSLDADYIATGHYARTQRTKNKKQKTEFKLFKGKDKNKDQSYFLWMLSQKQLKRVLFPVGNYTRKEVEKLAKKFKLPFSGVRKSQEICFIPNTIENFLKRHIKLKKGPVVEQVHYGVKKIIGQHQGLWFYTIGQRKGIGLPGGPFYVLDKDFKKNLLIVTKNERDLYKNELVAKNINWIAGKAPDLPLKVKAKIRYRHEPAAATIHKILNTKYKILFSSPQRAITPGQSVVFYLGKELLGGGIIC